MKVTIPERICPHCGGIEWYVSSKNAYECMVRRKETKHNWTKNNKEHLAEYSRNWEDAHKLSRKNASNKFSLKSTKILSDSYIKKVITQHSGRKFRDVTPEEIVIRRNKILEKREISKLPDEIKNKIREDNHRIVIKNWKVKNSKELSDKFIKTQYAYTLSRSGIPTKSIDITSDEVIKVRSHLIKVRIKKQLKMETLKTNRLDRAMALANDLQSNRSIVEKKRTYKKHASVKELEDMVSLSEEPVTETSNNEDITEEFKRIEKRRLEILNEVEIFNNYVESFKINLL